MIGEPGLLAGLGLRPVALIAWRGHVLNQLLDAQMQSDPAGLLADLEAGRWQEALLEDRRTQLREEAQEAHRRVLSQRQAELTRFSAQTALELSQKLARGSAGLADIRKAEAATLTLMGLGTVLLLGAAYVYSVNNAEAMGLDVFGDGFFHKMSVLQRWDSDLEAYVDESGRYLDKAGNVVHMDLKTGLIIPPEELWRYLSPPLEPQSGAEFNPGGFGEGVEVE